MEPLRRVVAVIDSLGQGGAERSLVDTLAALGDDVDVHIIVLRRVSEGFEQDAALAGITLHGAPGRFPRRVAQIRRLVRAVGPDVVHSSLWISDIATRAALVGTRFPLVTSLVTETYSKARLAGLRRQRQRWLVAAARHLDAITSRRVDVFHAVTAAVASDYERALHLDPSRVVVAWRGRDGTRFRPPSASERATARTTLAVEPPLLVTVGRLEDAKGHRYLIDAVARLRANGRSLSLLQIGRDGHAGTEVRSQIERLGLDDHVRLEGHQGDIVPYLWAADVFVLASTYEGIAGSVIEAMLAGVPVVATDLPGVREISLNGSLLTLTQSRDSDALAAALALVLDDPDAARDRARAASEHARSNFTMAAAADGLRGIYEAARRSRSEP